jgi:hypothetical protein
MKLIANGFAFDTGSGWEDRSVISVMGPVSAKGFAANLVVVREKISSRESLEEYAGRQAQAMSTQFPGVEILDERSIRINGMAAFQRLHRFRSEGHSIQQAQTFLLADGFIYTLTGTAELEEFDQHIQAFRQAVETFRVFDTREIAV